MVYMRKPKFKPRMTRVVLNPEQAVLSCNCFNGGVVGTQGQNFTLTGLCAPGVRSGGNLCVQGAVGNIGSS